MVQQEIPEPPEPKTLEKELPPAPPADSAIADYSRVLERDPNFPAAGRLRVRRLRRLSGCRALPLTHRAR
jgi:hypothetical protein